MAKKLAEEAVEVVIDAMMGSREAVVKESADLIYNLVVLWVSSGVQPREVWKEMERRERLFGIAEKLDQGSARRSAPQGRCSRTSAGAQATLGSAAHGHSRLAPLDPPRPGPYPGHRFFGGLGNEC